VHVLDEVRVGRRLRAGQLVKQAGEANRELTGPASTMKPEIFTPKLGKTTNAALPVCGTSVARPWPSTRVPGRETTIGCLRL
jgi:hypothetical protein